MAVTYALVMWLAFPGWPSAGPAVIDGFSSAAACQQSLQETQLKLVDKQNNGKKIGYYLLCVKKT